MVTSCVAERFSPPRVTFVVKSAMGKSPEPYWPEMVSCVPALSPVRSSSTSQLLPTRWKGIAVPSDFLTANS